MGKWFCSEKCVDEDEDIKELQKQQELVEKEKSDQSSEDPEIELWLKLTKFKLLLKSII